MQIHMVADKDGKPRGYAFIEYDRERDMNGKKSHTINA
jgi:RNA recognition motif-containing protein